MLYFSRPAYLKVRTRSAAYRLAIRDGERWRCPCPFCRRFVARHAFHDAAGRHWFDRARPQEVEAPDLRPRGALFDAYPLLSEPAGGELRGAVDDARIGHNDWALMRVVRALGGAARCRETLAAHLDRVVSDYERHTRAGHYGAAVRLAYRIALGERIP
jgi:hypothetical protein